MYTQNYTTNSCLNASAYIVHSEQTLFTIRKMFIFYVIALYTLQLGVTPTDYQCKEQNNDVDW
ncbi:hypothetical protein T08_10995 [Trichinella sp. T8]|nr:hypothetical protein T08_10995 [Trichinella sp. T8]